MQPLLNNLQANFSYYTVEPCNDQKEWNSLLQRELNNQLVTIAHNPSLGKILAKSFGYFSYNYWIKDNDEVIAVLPIVKIGKRMVSMPHFSYGGPIFMQGLDNQIKLEKFIDSKNLRSDHLKNIQILSTIKKLVAF